MCHGCVTACDFFSLSKAKNKEKADQNRSAFERIQIELLPDISQVILSCAELAHFRVFFNSYGGAGGAIIDFDVSESAVFVFFVDFGPFGLQ